MIAIASDHAGYLYKEEIKKYLKKKNIKFIDFGTDSEKSCNYAEFAIKAAESVSKKECRLGILVCGSGEGISIAANKVKNIRCSIGYNNQVTKLSRQHNDCNMIAFGARFMRLESIFKRIDIFLNTDFEEGRHYNRLETIREYESK